MKPERDFQTLTRAADIIKAYVANNRIQASDLPDLIQSVHAAFVRLINPMTESAEPNFEKPSQAAIRRSIRPDGLISFIDGKSYKLLKRHLAKNRLRFPEYKVRYGLPHDYPSVCSDYSAALSELARRTGFGPSDGNPRPRLDDIEGDSLSPVMAARLRGRRPKAA